MSMRSWIRSLFTRPATRTIRKAPRRARLSLETLEERWCPSTIVVNSVLDNVNDANITGPTITLREAVNYENANGGGAITFDPTAFATATPQTIKLAFGQLELMTGTETITGPAAGVTVSGGGLSRVFQVDSMVTALISGLTISGGNAGAFGNGGGLNNLGTTTLSNCTLSGNFAGDLTADVTGYGGAVYGGAASTTTLTDCTIAGNSASSGGGIEAYAALTLTNCTLSGNSGFNGTGGLESFGTATLTNTIVAGQNAGSDVSVLSLSGTNNLIGTGYAGGLADGVDGNLVGVTNPSLTPLGDYGGPTQTMVPLFGSPAIGAGDNTGGPATDQRGFARGTGAGAIIGAVEGVAFTVTNTSDSGAGSLRQAVSDVNTTGSADVILFSCLFNSAQTITLTTGQLTLTDSAATMISGPGANLLSVSGNHASRVFGIGAGAAAALSGLTISGGNAGTSGNGGGLANFGNTTLSNCTLSGNFAGDLTTDVSGYGGAVYGGAASTTTLNDCTVSGNTAVWGGGLDGHGTLTLNNCDVINNVANHAGALENYLGTTTLNDCVVSGNKSKVSGGGLFLVGGQTTLSNCTVSGNEGLRGGGLSTKNGTVQLVDCTVSGNTATALHGGGVYNDHSNMTLTNCTISGNSAVVNSGGVQGDGGGLLSYGGQTTLTNCTVSGNSSYRGAGVFAVLTTVQMVNSTVSGNTTTGGSGGGVYNNTSTVTLANCTISGNSAVRKGGGVFSFGTTTLTGCTLSGNSASAGGGLYMNSASATLLNCTISGNSASAGGGGGGIFNSSSSTTTLTNCTISGNTAGSGGGLDNYGKATLINSTVSGNSGINGAGMNSSGTITLTNCTISGNSASGSTPFNGGGGGLWNTGTATLTNCTVSGNTAGVTGLSSAFYGGGGLVNFNILRIANSIVAGNTTTSSGPDVRNNITSLGYNLIGKTDGSSGWANSDLKGGSGKAPLNPLLAPLGYYGGPTQTMPLLSGSLAIDAGKNSLIPAGITTDQRGLTRTVNTTVDIGAFESGAFDLQSATPPGVPTTVYVSAPAATTAGQPVSVTVTVLDAFGNVATGYVGVVHFSSSDLSAGLPNNYTFTSADAGRHTFSVTLKKAGTQSITATDTLTGGLTFTAGGIVVSPAAAAQFVLSAPPGVKHGVAFSLTLTVQDAYGNTVTGYVGTVKFTSSDGTANLPASYTFTNADQGVHTFSGLVLKKTSKQTITLTDKQNSSLTGTLTEVVS